MTLSVPLVCPPSLAQCILSLINFSLLVTQPSFTCHPPVTLFLFPIHHRDTFARFVCIYCDGLTQNPTARPWWWFRCSGLLRAYELLICHCPNLPTTMSVLLNLWLHIPTGLRLQVYQVWIRRGLWLYGPTSSRRCFRLPFNLYAKTGLNVFMSEANAMRYITKNTTISIPSVIDAIQIPTGAFIVMTRMAGEPLTGGLRKMSAKERSLLASDLKNSFDQLRSIPAPSTGPHICGIGGGSFRCFRISSDYIGPFATGPDFYRFLYERVYLQERSRLEQFAHEVHNTSYRICLSHNDLNPHNILIDNNCWLSAIVDWECSTWLPAYWDYTRSYFHRDAYYEWQYLMDNVFGLWPKELRVEKELWKFNDPF